MPLLNRRGMSPLIATVLLMAFAVALGGLAMNVTSGDLTSSSTLGCGKVTLDVLQFCRDDTGINVRVRNTGDVAVAGLLLNVDGPDGQFAVKLKDSKLAPNAGLTTKLSLLVTSETSVSLLPILDENAPACPAIASQKPLPKC